MLVKLVANKMLSNSFVSCEDLKDLCDVIAPEYSIPCLNSFKHTLVPLEFERIENKIKGILNLADYCSITVDLWSNRSMRAYMGITCHLIDNNYKLHSFLLQCERFKGNHTAANISLRVQAVIAKFELAEKLDFIISDNAANMVAAFDLPAFSNFSSENDELIALDVEGEVDQYITFAKHARCFAHSLQLVIKHAFQQCQVPDLLRKAHRIVTHVRKSNIAVDHLDGETRAQPSNQTRWNSQLTMIRSILKIDRTKLDTVPGLNHSDNLSNSERANLTEFEQLMESFEEATNRIQGIISY